MKYTLICFFLIAAIVRGQDTTKLSVKQAELDQIKKEISDLEKELKQKTQSERKSIKVIENLNKQNLLLNKAISALKTEEQQRSVKISRTEKDVSTLTDEIKSLRKSYANYLLYLYKYGKDFELNSIVASNSFNQALIKYKYFNKISDQKKWEVNKLVEDKNKLALLRSGLIKESEEKKIVTDQKLNEEERLRTKLSEKKEVLKNLKNDKASLNEEIELKKKASGEIKNMITRLIIEERKRAEEIKKQKELAEKNRLEEEKNKPATEVIPNNVSISRNTEKISSEVVAPVMGTSLIKKGSLLWPVDKGSVYKKFGETKNPKLKTVTINTGIDIKTGENTDVKSVADGTVSVINWVPGYGSVIIVTHRNGFRSVYGHLSEIFVTEGESIKGGAALGKVGESLEGNILHFELWIERNNQNPETWLTRK